MAPQNITDIDSSHRNKSIVVAVFFTIIAGGLIGILAPSFESLSITHLFIAFLGGGSIGAFIYRERILVNRLYTMQRNLIEEAGVYNSRIEHLYMKSLACLVEFDRRSLIIDRASIGFFDLLGVGADVDLRGRRLDDVLGVGQSEVDGLLAHISNGSGGLREAIECKRSDGTPFHLFVSAYALEESNMIEAAFFLANQDGSDRQDVEQMVGDLERFRKGMIRREERILELKGEVNELLKESKQPVRYRVDDRSDDTRFSVKLEEKSKERLSL